MRKAFDANVPKLKPRLRPAMVVVSDTKEEVNDENADHSMGQPITETTASAPEEVLNSDPADTSESITNENASSVETTDEDNDTAPEVLEKEHTIHLKKPDTIDGNIVPFPNTAPKKNDATENEEELPEQNRLRAQEELHSTQLIDSTITETGNDIADQQTQSAESLSVVDIKNPPELQHSLHDETTTSPSEPVYTIDNSDTRRKRLENVKRKVSEAVRPEIRIEPVPEDPALAVESVLGLVNDLEEQLSLSREVENALRNELEEAKADLTRTVNDERTASGRLAQAEAQLDEKRRILEEMLFEMGALEEERDQAVRMVQMLTLKDKERQREFDDVRQRCTEMQRALDESKFEEERLTEELDESSAENSRLHTLLAEITRERDALSRNVELLTLERDELSEAKKALEKVHHALSQARARLRQ